MASVVGKNGASAFLTADEIFSGKTFRYVDVELAPGKKVRLRHFRPHEQMALQQEREEIEEKKSRGEEVKETDNFTRLARIFVALAVKEDGTPLFDVDDEHASEMAERLMNGISTSALIEGITKVSAASNGELVEAGKG